MKYKLLHRGDDYDWFFNLFDDGTKEYQERFLERAYKKMLDADTPLEVAQKVLKADSPVEVALEAIQSEEQLNEFLSRIQQRNQKRATMSTQGAAASA